MKIKDILWNGIVKENPTFRLVLGMCPTLALTTAAINGIGMGLAVVFVLSMSNLFISLLRNYISEKIRICCHHCGIRNHRRHADACICTDII